MKNKILNLIASSKNGYELADKICELVEKEKIKTKLQLLRRIIKPLKGKSALFGAVALGEALTKELESLHPTPGMGKGKKV